MFKKIILIFLCLLNLYGSEFFSDEIAVKDMKIYIADQVGVKYLELEEFQTKYPKIISKQINDYIEKKKITLISNTSKTVLKYRFSGNNILFTTEAKYYTNKLKCKGKSLDFDIATVANFGLRGLYIKDNCKVKEFGSYNTAYYSVAYDKKNNLLAYTIPGQGKIDIYNNKNHTLLYTIDGYSASTLEFNKGILYFAGYKKGNNWKESTVYKYNIKTNKVLTQYFTKKLADVRGLSFYNNLMAVSNGVFNEVYIYDLKEDKTITTIKGLTYPNGNFLIDSNNILIADEHYNFVRKINFKTNVEEWHSPTFQLKSPGGVHMLNRGKFKGYYLISDTDNNRVIVVEPKKWKIIYAISGIRSCLKSIPIYHEGVQ